MDLFHKSRTRAVTETISPTKSDHQIDLIRFERLLETSIRLRDSGIDYESIQRRASADDVSWNEALEAIDRERFHG